MIRVAGLRTALAALILAGNGCDSSRPEERLAASRAQLEQVQSELAEAKEDVEARRQALAEAERRLARAQKAVDQLEKQQENAQQRLAQRATDVAIFRALQQKLLERESLESVAIVAEVKERVVTLRGTVPDPELREEAEEIAHGTPGVDEVRNRIRLESATGEETLTSESPGDPPEAPG